MSEVEKFLEKHWLYIVGGVIAYFAIKKVLGVAGVVADAAGSAIATTYVDLTQPPAVKLLASIVLPNGQLVDANSVTLDDSMQFRFGGILYRLDHRNSDNNYVAVIA